MIAVPHREAGTGDHRAPVLADIPAQHLILAGVIGKDHRAILPGHHQRAAALLHFGKLQVHGHLLGIALRPVHGGAKGNDGTAVYIRTQVGVQARIRNGIGGGHHRAAVDHQVAVGIDAVAFCPQSGNDMHIAAVDGGDGNAVLVGIDAVIAGTDGDIAAVDGQVQLRVHTLIVRSQIQGTGAEHIHGHIGINGAVLLPQLLFPFLVLIDPGNVGTGNLIASLQDQVGTGCRGIHLCLGRFHRPVSVTFVGIPEQNGRCHRAGDVCPVQDQLHHRLRFKIGGISQIHPDLASGQLAPDPVCAGSRDVHHSVGCRLLCRVPVRLRAFAIGIAAVIAVPVFIIDNIVRDIHRLLRAGDGDAVIGQLDQRLVSKPGFVDGSLLLLPGHDPPEALRCRRHCPGGLRNRRLRRRLGSTAGEHQTRQHQCCQFFHKHTILSYICADSIHRQP